MDYGVSAILSGYNGRRNLCLDVLGKALFGGASRSESTTHIYFLLHLVWLPPQPPRLLLEILSYIPVLTRF